MYRETKETITTILLTALIVGGGMYAYYNYDIIQTPDTDEAEITEEVIEETENTQNTITADKSEEKTKPITYKTIDIGTLYQIDIPSTWIVENVPTKDGRKASRIVDENNIKVGEIFCPLIETSYPGWNIETMEKMLNLNQIVLWKATQEESNTRDIKAMAILFLHSRNYQARCQIGISIVDHDQETIFDTYEHMYDSVKIKEQTFEPKTFNNNVMKYSIDHPKDWYWNHYGYQNEVMKDIAAFSTNPLSEYLGSYPGKITIQVLDRDLDTVVNEGSQDLENMTKEVIEFNGISAAKVRGQLPSDGMSVGDSNVVLSIFFQKDGLTYIINTMGSTPEEEQIFNQMIESFKFTN